MPLLRGLPFAGVLALAAFVGTGWCRDRYRLEIAASVCDLPSSSRSRTSRIRS